MPDHPPPSGYICYRCGEKGHWIQVCPTNDDPAYENRPRVKRTTGIPRSFLKSVDKPTTITNDGTIDETKQPSGVMINAEGEWVIAEPDQAAWDVYQAKAKGSAAAQKAAKQGSEDLQNRGLECSIDKRLFLDPTKTPCCHTTFCHDCITNALLENDLRCPHCSTENILIDDLKADEAMITKTREYEEHECLPLAQTNKTETHVHTSHDEVAQLSSTNDSSKHTSPRKDQPSGNPRKRSAESELLNSRVSRGFSPVITRPSSGSSNPKMKKDSLVRTTNTPPASQSALTASGNVSVPPSSNAMTFPSMNNFMPMAPAMGLHQTFQSPMMMSNGNYPNNEWNHMYSMNFAQRPTNIQGVNFQNGMMPNGAYSQSTNFMNLNMNIMAGSNGTNGFHVHSARSQGKGPFANQQRTAFSGTASNDEDNAYFRKPVNPHRHQARRNVPRPTDYREI